MKAYTDLKQSKKLVEILPIKSADMWFANGIYLIKTSEEPKDIQGVFPCWSLAALLSVLPESIEFKGNNYYLRFMKEYVEYANDEVSITGRCLHTIGNNLVDAVFEMILKLNEQKIL